MSPICAAVCSGIDKEPVLKVLMEAKADLKQKRRWGGDSSLLCMVANNEDSQCGALRLLMENGCDVNATWSAHSTLFSTALKAARLGSKLLPDRPLQELSVLQGSTPLLLARKSFILSIPFYSFGLSRHFAAKRGDVEMVRQLITAKADVHCRNREGRRPIDVARSFFGGEAGLLRLALKLLQVPMALSVALLADGEDDVEEFHASA